MECSIPMTFGDKIKADFSFQKIVGNKEYAFCEHWHACFEILQVKVGCFKVILEGEEYVLEKGDIAIIPPRIRHSTASVGGYREVNVFGYVENLIYSPELSLINMKYLAPFRYGTGAKYFVLSSKDKQTNSLYQLLTEAMQAYDRDGFERELCIRSKILDIHAQVCSISLENNAYVLTQDSYLMEVQLYIEHHICEDISPYEIAESIHISYSHLSRLIRKAYGCSLGSLVLRMKLNYAERMMTDHSGVTITDIALRSGFNSASYFARCFRRIKGVSPQKFRSMLKRTTL